MPAMKLLARRLLLALVLGAAGAGGAQSAFAQRAPYLSPQERERLRQDLDSARRDQYRGREQERARQQPDQQQRRGERLSPGERERLRRDVMDANRNMRRRR